MNLDDGNDKKKRSRQISIDSILTTRHVTHDLTAACTAGLGSSLVARRLSEY